MEWYPSRDGQGIGNDQTHFPTLPLEEKKNVVIRANHQQKSTIVEPIGMETRMALE